MVALDERDINVHKTAGVNHPKDLPYSLPRIPYVFQRTSTEYTVKGLVRNRHFVDVTNQIYFALSDGIESDYAGADSPPASTDIKNSSIGRQHGQR